uniref:Uncharacterized protein n=1 Tax=Anguilla anguilla TaxID=7936 RepID=A0A0E9RP22_ANGAN
MPVLYYLYQLHT